MHRPLLSEVAAPPPLDLHARVLSSPRLNLSPGQACRLAYGVGPTVTSDPTFMVPLLWLATGKPSFPLGTSAPATLSRPVTRTPAKPSTPPCAATRGCRATRSTSIRRAPIRPSRTWCATSDVDIAVELTELYIPEFIHDAEGLTLDDVGTPYTGNATLAGFKDDVAAALTSAFGKTAVRRGDKSIHIRESTRSLKADVVACVTHKTWISRSTVRVGIQLRSDTQPWQEIVNYPKQHLICGTRKNDATSRRYKRVVRILKRLENEMVDKQVIDIVPSLPH